MKKILLILTMLVFNIKAQEWQKKFSTLNRQEKIRATDETLNLFLREVNPKANYEPVLNETICNESEEKIKNLINLIIILFKETAQKDYQNKFDKMTNELRLEAEKLSQYHLKALTKATNDTERLALTKNYANDQFKLAKAYREKSDKAKAEVRSVLINYYFNCYKFMAHSSNYNPIVFIKFDKNSKDNPLQIAPELKSKL